MDSRVRGNDKGPQVNVAWGGNPRYNHRMEMRSVEASDKEIQSFLEQQEMGADANLIGVLQETQKQFGYLPGKALDQIGRRMKIPLSRIYGVVSFYAQFYMSPRGRHTIRCCRGTACHVRGGNRIIDVIRKSLGINEGETTEDMMFTFETVGCLGACALAPVAMLDSTYIGKATSEGIESVLNNIRAEESGCRKQG